MWTLMDDFLKYAKSLGYIVLDLGIKSREYITFPDTQNTYAMMIIDHNNIFSANTLSIDENTFSFFGVNAVSIEEAKELLRKFIFQRKNISIKLKKKALEKDF